MALILSQKRRQLLDFLAEDPGLRAFLWRRWQAQMSGAVPYGLTADAVAEAVASSTAPDALVAAALLQADPSVAAAARHWAEDVTRIPAPGQSMTVTATTGPAIPDAAVTLPAKLGEAVELAEHRSLSDVDDVARAHGPTTAPPESGHLSDPASITTADEKLDELARELDGAQAIVRRLEAANIELKSKVPTRGAERRVKKDRGELQRVTAKLSDVTDQVEALREERDQLLVRLRSVEVELEDAIEEKAKAERSRRTLEDRISTVEGRADYLRRSLDSELRTAEAACQDPSAKERTRASRRVQLLRDLGSLLGQLFPTSDIEEGATTRAHVVVRDERGVSVVPIGGAEEIGGSALLVRFGDTRILVDAGMHPAGGGPRDLAVLNSEPRIDAVIVTHAHNDHGGYVPALLQRFRCPVIATAATAQLLPTMWSDSATVMQREFDDRRRWGEVRRPLYGEAEVEEAERRITEMPHHRAKRIRDVEVTLFPAGHVLGAAGAVLYAGGRRVVISGDITAPTDEHLAVDPTHLPTGLVRQADLLVIESTYCHSSHSSREREVGSLVAVVKDVVARRGRVLIPAFGLGRAQEVAMILAKELPNVEVLVDGLAKSISEIYENLTDSDVAPRQVFTGRVRPVRNRNREMKAFSAGVIVSTSGMLNGGPAVQWAQSILPDENDALLLCGYQDEDAPGRKLERLAGGGGVKTIDLPDLERGTVTLPVRARVERYQLSAHADKDGLLSIVDEVDPAEVMLVHGERRNQARFRETLRQAGYSAVATGELTL